MSEYTFGDYDPSDDQSGLGEAEGQPQGPKWFRDGLARLSGQVQELRAENEALKAARVKVDVADALKAKGYAPGAADLYQGTPDQLDAWLTAHGGALAKLPVDGQEQAIEQPPTGPPASTVPADDQSQMQRMAEAGTQGVLPPQGSEAELVQRLKNASTEEEFAQIMRAHGNTHDWV